MAHRHEDRVIAEALVATRRPDKDPIDPSVEGLGLPIVGPGNRERAGEVGGRRGYFYAAARSIPDAPLDTMKSVTWETQTVICFGPCTKGDAQ